MTASLPEVVVAPQSGAPAQAVAVGAADLPIDGELMMRVRAAMAQKERELIGERTRAALAAAKARGRVLGGDRGWVLSDRDLSNAVDRTI